MLSLVCAIYDAIARLAPFAARDVRSASARTTFRTVCMRALERRGLTGLLTEAGKECADLMVTIVQSHLAHRSPGSRLLGASLRRDLRLASRALVADGRSTWIAASTLAIGIGISAAVFTVLDATLWHPVPFRDATRLVEIWNFSTMQKFSFGGFSQPLFREWRRQPDLFDRVEGYERESYIYDAERGSEMLAGAVVTAGTFDLLGVNAARGRAFVAGDGRDGAPAVAVISDAFWREALGSAEDFDRRTVHLNGRAYQVVGVMPRAFRFPTGSESIWTPYDVDRPPPTMKPPTLTALGRIAPHVTFAQARDAVNARGSFLSEAAGGPRELTGSLVRVGTSIDDVTASSLWVLSGAVAFLFLIVCANVANITLSRSLARARALATCAALGATPGDLVRVTVCEQLLLAGLGAAGGLAVAAITIRLAVVSLPDALLDGTLNTIDLDQRALVFMMGTALLSTVLAGLTPALLASRTAVATVLSRDGRTASGSRPTRRLRSALVVAEVAISVVLLIGAALMTRSFLTLAAADHGYEPSDLVSLQLGLPAAGYQDVGLREQVTRDIVERIAALPHVDGVTSGGLPTDPNMAALGRLEVDTRAEATGPQAVIPVHEVPANYFSVLQLPLITGRAFRADDARDAVVINQRLAARYFPSQNPVGRRVRIAGKDWHTVIGVAANTRSDAPGSADRMEMFYAIGTATDAARPVMRASAIADYRTILIRTTEPLGVIRQLTRVVHDRDPAVIVWKTALVEHLLGEAIARPRVVFRVLTAFAAFGLLLAMAGLYGVLSCLVSQRRQEIGVRIALGASTSQVRRLVVGNGLGLTAIGLLLGLAAALPLVRLLRTLLYQVDTADPLAVVGSVTLMTITAGIACWWPARDAGRINPVDLLRGD